MNMLGLNMRPSDWPGWFALTQSQGVPLRIVISGKVYERLWADDGNGFLYDDDTGWPRYARIS